jgi:murein DD-endopeptidase MepM/ murein hydrolase activator NlpD
VDLRRLASLRLLLAGTLLAPLACGEELTEAESESWTGFATFGSSGEASSSGSGAGSVSSTSGEGGDTSTSTSGSTTTGPTTTTTTTTAGTDDPELTTDDTSTTTTGGSTTTGDDECPRVRVELPPGEVLNVRPAPTTDNTPLGTLPAGAIVDVVDLVTGEALEGNDEWFEIAGLGLEGFVWSGLVMCTLDEPLEPPDGFLLPLQCGTSAKVSQGNFGQYSHQGQSAYAFDFSVGTGTPLVAIADGEVSFVYAGTKPGDPCYNGGDQSCSGKANVVVLKHGDGTTSIYAHLSEVQVGVGELVPRGAPVGLSGSTGWSTGRHAHVARQEGCGGSWCQSIAVAFGDVPGDGVPKTGQTVTSMNCP